MSALIHWPLRMVQSIDVLIACFRHVAITNILVARALEADFCPTSDGAVTDFYSPQCLDAHMNQRWPTASLRRGSDVLVLAVTLWSCAGSAFADTQTRTAGEALTAILTAPVDFGAGIGAAGAGFMDTDGDGWLEFVATTGASENSNTRWFVSEYDSNIGEYRVLRISDTASGRYTAFELIPDSLSTSPLAVAGVDAIVRHSLQVIDLDSGSIVSQVDDLPNDVRAFAFGDADNDGTDEIVAVTSNLQGEGAVYIFSAESYHLEHSMTFPGNDVAVGNVDSDPRNEIVVASGWVLEFDGATTTIDWDFTEIADERSEVTLSDLDGDNSAELLVTQFGAGIGLLDVGTQTVAWELPVPGVVAGIVVAEIDGDPTQELIVGTSSSKIYTYDTSTRQLQWSYDTLWESGIDYLAVLDVDSDSEAEIFLTAGGGNSGPDHIHILDAASQAIEWESYDVDPPFYGDFGDVDGDGEDEIVFASASSDSGNLPGLVFVYDQASLAFEARTSTSLLGPEYFWLYDIAVGDVDKDGAEEILLTTNRNGDAAIVVLDGADLQIENSFTYDLSTTNVSFGPIVVADIDTEPGLEIVVATLQSPARLLAVDGVTGAVKWSVDTGIGGSTNYLSIGDVDGDPALEAIVSAGALVVVDLDSHEYWSVPGVKWGATLVDLDGDGISEIVSAATDELVSINGTTQQVTNWGEVCDHGSVRSTRLLNADGFESVFAHTCQQSLVVRQLGSVAPLWEEEVYGSGLGGLDNLLVQKIQQDGRRLLAPTAAGITLFEADSDLDGFLDSFDNCQQTPNPDAIDSDADGIGNLCDADLTNDCMINVADLGAMRVVFFTNDPDADLNSDGLVNAVDLGLMKANFFSVPGPSGLLNLCSSQTTGG